MCKKNALKTDIQNVIVTVSKLCHLFKCTIMEKKVRNDCIINR